MHVSTLIVMSSVANDFQGLPVILLDCTQNRALQAILFFYFHVLEMDPPWLDGVVRAKPKRRNPVVLSVEEVSPLLANISVQQQMNSIVYLYTLLTKVVQVILGDGDS